MEDRIKYEGNNALLFEKRSADGLSKRAELIVPATHYAILVKDGQMMDTLDSGRHPVFEGKEEKRTQDVTVDVIFISKTVKLAIRWGTKEQFAFRDEETGVPVRVGARGQFEVQVMNPRKFYLLFVGADAVYDVEKLKERLEIRLLAEAESAIAAAMRENALTYDRLAENKLKISEAVRPVLAKMFEEDYGLKLFSFTIAGFLIADEDIRAVEERRRALQERAAAEESARLDREEQIRREEAELEKLRFEWEKEKYLRELSARDYERYLEVCRAIGWEGKATPQRAGTLRGAPKKRCPHCGAELRTGDRFCSGCGKSVGEKKTCAQCGEPLPAGASFCPACGARSKE
ncbi:MAG: SPFH domain-containing protein [Christensenellaceae bacterium]